MLSYRIWPIINGNFFNIPFVMYKKIYDNLRFSIFCLIPRYPFAEIHNFSHSCCYKNGDYLAPFISVLSVAGCHPTYGIFLCIFPFFLLVNSNMTQIKS